MASRSSGSVWPGELCGFPFVDLRQCENLLRLLFVRLGLCEELLRLLFAHLRLHEQLHGLLPGPQSPTPFLRKARSVRPTFKKN